MSGKQDATTQAENIKSTGDLRDFLVRTMSMVVSGAMDVDRAARVTKIAAQVNESFYSEIKVGQIRQEAGEKLADLGALPIGSLKK